MCELLGLSSAQAVSFTCSLDRFAAHGSADGPNHDGWGIAAYQGPDARIVKEPAPAALSEWVRFMEHHGVSSDLVIAHIRRASRGIPRYANTHPFSRELGGRLHTFAHNGTLPGIHELPLGRQGFHPIGETDSERAFCVLLARLTKAWSAGAPPGIHARQDVVAGFAEELAQLGPANFLYSDGELLFAHGHIRRHENGQIKPPGLYLAQRGDVPADHSWLASGMGLSGAAPGRGPDPGTAPRRARLRASPESARSHPWRPRTRGSPPACRPCIGRCWL